ncbi:ABC transporter substrate-binding protein [Candidatus Bathyarchaeota archaeon]|nr:ABC transporter substrate-binding protein [Candidatus Bathyarchaeota archaeon]
MNGEGLTKIQAALLMFLVVAAAIAASLIITGCFKPQQDGVASNYVVDVVGRRVRLPENVSRVVAIGPGVLRLVCYLNAVDMLVGVEQSEVNWGFIGRDYAMAYGELFSKLPVIGPGGPGKPPAPELILSVKPDLIVMSRTYCDFYDPDRLQSETKSTVIVVDYGPAGQLDVVGIKNALRLLGEALNRRERAEELISFIERVYDDLNQRTKNVASRPKVYVGAVSYKGAQPFTTTQTPFPPLALLNTPSIADKYSNVTGAFFWDFEAIIAEDPDFIFIDEGNLATVKQDFDKDPNKYMQLRAFREGKIYGTLPYNYYHTNIAVAIANAYYIGKVLYPDKFSDVDPKAKADEIFSVFLGKPLYQEYAEAYGGFKCLSEIFEAPR